MDEILIEEKKYISSKRAAKVTGYAKDYVGQLCREGRVSARLVGRNWYVLETAIHDHRFGESNLESGNTAHDAPSAPAPVSTWESPRYEAVSADSFPSISPHRDADEADKIEENVAPQHLQDSWKEWFDRVADTTAPAIPETIPEKSVEKEDQKDEKELFSEEKEAIVPIRTIHHQSRYQSPPEELLPQEVPHHHIETRKMNESVEDVPLQTQGQISAKAIAMIRIAGISFAGVMVALAIIGSGYFDKYILSSNRASLISGVVLYTK